jgi:rRNA maturation RNase YbeY
LNIVFSYLGINKHLNFASNVRELIVLIIEKEKKRLGEINIIFTSNSIILEINKSYLNHNYFTDVITFNNNKRDKISGDIYISLDQIKLNAKKYRTKYLNELIRVIIHGVLHLIGYEDKSDSQRVIMRKMEDTYLCEFKINISVEGSGCKL